MGKGPNNTGLPTQMDVESSQMQPLNQATGARVICKNCGRETESDGVYCKHCGFSIAKVRYTWAWWLLPVFLSIDGGLIAYAGVRRMNKRSAGWMLILSILLFLLIIVGGVAAYYYFATASMAP